MTIFARKSFAFKNPNSTSDKDREILCPYQQFSYNIPDNFKKDPYFMGLVKSGDITIMSEPKDMDKALKNPTGKRNGAQHEQTAEALGILEGGDKK